MVYNPLFGNMETFYFNLSARRSACNSSGQGVLPEAFQHLLHHQGRPVSGVEARIHQRGVCPLRLTGLSNQQIQFDTAALVENKRTIESSLPSPRFSLHPCIITSRICCLRCSVCFGIFRLSSHAASNAGDQPSSSQSMRFNDLIPS